MIKKESSLKINKDKSVSHFLSRKKQGNPQKNIKLIQIKVRSKIERTEWSKTEDGRHVHIIFKNAERNSIKNARKNRTSTMGQWERSNSIEKDERPIRVI